MIYIRTDANPKIGMGHIMRCLSIADAAKELGFESTFILSDDNVQSMVISRGYQTIILHSDYTIMEEEIWPEINPEIIVIDSYYVTKNYLASIREKGITAYIDDLAAFSYPVDILINYNIYGPYLDYHRLYTASNVEEPLYILGASYAPLREMFRGIPPKKQLAAVRNILISTGGSDPHHFALKLVKSKPTKYTYHILLGNMNEDKEMICVLASHNSNIVIHENVVDMEKLISMMDIAVSAAGSTLYEICACGVPLITYILADNQIPGAVAFEKLGMALNLGDIRGVSDPIKKFLSAIDQLADNYQLRLKVGNKMQSMIDGYGAKRMVNEIMRFVSTSMN